LGVGAKCEPSGKNGKNAVALRLRTYQAENRAVILAKTGGRFKTKGGVHFHVPDVNNRSLSVDRETRSAQTIRRLTVAHSYASRPGHYRLLISE
jgi:urease beta subunit